MCYNAGTIFKLKYVVTYLVTLYIHTSTCLGPKKEKEKKKKNSMKGLERVHYFTSKDPITLVVILCL